MNRKGYFGPFPQTVSINLTNICNLNCRHCYAKDTMEIKQDPLSFPEWLVLFRGLDELGVKNISILGGEPFLYAHLDKLLIYIDQKFKFNIIISTNATVLKPSHLRCLQALKKKPVVQVSVDGANATSHDWQRGKGASKKANEGILLLAKHGLIPRIKLCLNRNNMNELEKIILKYEKVGIKHFNFGFTEQVGKTRLENKNYYFSPREYKDIFAKMLMLKKKYPMICVSDSAVSLASAWHGHKNKQLDVLKKKILPCGAGRSTLMIGTNGDVYPCAMWQNMKCGNIKKQTLVQIWQYSKNLNRIRKLWGKPLIGFTECQKCSFLPFCSGGCQAIRKYLNAERNLNCAQCVIFGNND